MMPNRGGTLNNNRKLLGLPEQWRRRRSPVTSWGRQGFGHQWRLQTPSPNTEQQLQNKKMSSTQGKNDKIKRKMPSLFVNDVFIGSQHNGQVYKAGFGDSFLRKILAPCALAEHPVASPADSPSRLSRAPGDKPPDCCCSCRNWMMEKARRLLSAMMTEPRTSLQPRRE